MAFAIIMLILLAFLIGWTVWYVIDFKKNGKSNSVADLRKVVEIFDNSMKKSFSEAVNLRNNIDHCPKCGSANIKLYRKGYNYKVGFWGAIFGVRGAGYAGGFDANKTCCRCMDCGKDWETDYDYRLINK